MFDLGMQELIIIFVVALIVFGPNKLPELARTLGKGMRELKRAMHGIKNTIEEADIRESMNNKIADFTLSPPSDKDIARFKGKRDIPEEHDKEESRLENTSPFNPSCSLEKDDIEIEEKDKERTESLTITDNDKRNSERQ